MKASALLVKLQSLIDLHGDCDIIHSMGEDDLHFDLQEVYHHTCVDDAPAGVFQMSCDYGDRDDQQMWYDADGKFSHRGIE